MELNALSNHAGVDASVVRPESHDSDADKSAQVSKGSVVSQNASAVKVTTGAGEESVNEGDAEVSEDHLKSLMSVTNSKIKMTNTRCEFEFHEKTNRVSIKVIDKDTEEVVREIPPEKTLKMVEKIWELAGLLVDEKL